MRTEDDDTSGHGDRFLRSVEHWLTCSAGIVGDGGRSG